MKPVAITFGRMNPPTIGHQKLVDHLHSVAKKHGADAEVHLSHTQDSKKNPLSHSQKVGLARKAFGSSVQSGPHKTIIDVMKHLHKQGRKEVHVVVGGDRHKEMHELLHKYNGKDYHFDKIHVHSAGERDPDAEGAEGMSASKMREHAKNKNHEAFKSGLPTGLRSSSHRVMKMVRSGMGHVEEGDPFGGGTSAFTPADREMPQTAVSMQHEEDPDGPDEPNSSEAIGAHDELNHKLFVDDRLMPEVRIQLRKIADQFIRFVAVPLDVKDIVFTGSNASYHYTDHSDIDLHVIVKLKGGASMRAYMRQLFDAKKSLWNQMHNITIRGFEVELYIEPTEEPAVSSGVYSIQDDKWVKHPTNQKPTMDDVSIRSKYRQYKDEIDAAVKSNNMSEIGALLAELREMRRSGLAKGGEYSVENIVYKLLRSRGDLQKLWSIQSELGDKELSLESAHKTKKYRKRVDDNYNANDVQFNPPELPVRYSYLSASYNKRFEEFAEAAGYRDMFRGIVPHGLDPTTEPLSHAVPTSRYDLESADSASKLVQDKHRREKETLAKKHERERESMRMQDLRKKMLQRNEEIEQVGETVSSISVNEAFGQMVKSADYEYKKEKLPDGRIVYRKVHKKLKVEGDPNSLHRQTGTDSLVKTYKKDTPGQNESANDARYMAPVPWAKQTTEDSKSPKTFEDVRKALSGLREQTELSEDFVPGIMDAPTAQQLGIRAHFGYADHPSVEEEKDHDCDCEGDCECDDVEEELEITEAEYQGRKVTLNKPFRTPGGPKKSAVYTTNGSGNVVLVRFGDPNMTIKKNIPGRRRNFRARHNCDNPGPRWKARYWSCRAW